MDAYTSFAAVYDTFMDNIPYEEWKSYLEELLKEYGVQDGLVLDLGCGTGTMTGTSCSRWLRYDRSGQFRGNAGDRQRKADQVRT